MPTHYRLECEPNETRQEVARRLAELRSNFPEHFSLDWSYTRLHAKTQRSEAENWIFANRWWSKRWKRLEKRKTATAKWMV